MGYTDAIWQEACEPKDGLIHDLDHHTPLYLDCYVALRVLGMLYSDYIQRASPQERLLNQLFLGLEAAKETHERWHIEQERDIDDTHGLAHDPRSRG